MTVTVKAMDPGAPLVAEPTGGRKWVIGFVERQLEDIREALAVETDAERYCQLFAAQQALSWTLNPTMFDSPLNTIQRGAVQPLPQMHWKSHEALQRG